VPDTALGSDQSGRYLPSSTQTTSSSSARCWSARWNGGLRVIEGGLKPDDRVVVAGLFAGEIPGQKVDPQPQKIEPSTASSK